MLLQASNEDGDNLGPYPRQSISLNKEIQLKAKISQLEKENEKFKKDYSIALETIKRYRVYSNFFNCLTLKTKDCLFI